MKKSYITLFSFSSLFQRKGTLFFSCFLFFMGINLLSSQIFFEAEANPTETEMGDKIRVDFTLTIKQDIRRLDESITLPDFDGFEVLYHGKSESTNLINGRVSRELSYQVVVRPLKTGNLKIKSATVKIDGKVYKTQPITIKVSGESSGNSSPNRSPAPTPRRSPPSTKPKSGTFIQFEVDKRNPYVNEGFYGTLVLYTQNYTILSRISSVQPPTIKGVTMIPIDKRRSAEQVAYQGEVYIKAVLGEYVLYPLRSGEIEIPPYSMGIIESDGFFNQEEVFISSDPIFLQVKSLPENKPKNFSGAVGNFTMNMNVDKTDLEANTKTNVEVEIIGTGNFKLVKAPKLEVPPEVETYNSTVRDSYQATAQGLKGKIVSTSTLVPTYGGNFEIKSEPFAFFNPEEEKYEEITPPPLKIEVEGEEKSKDRAQTNPSTPDDSDSASTGLGNFSFSPAQTIQEFMVDEEKQNKVYLIGIPLLLVMLSIGGYYLVKKQFKPKTKNKEETTTVAHQTPIPAPIVPIKESMPTAETKTYAYELSELESLASFNRKNDYYGKLEKLLKELASKNSSVPLTMEEMENEMLKNYGEQAFNRWKEIILTCQMEKYSPIQDVENLTAFHQETKPILSGWM